MRNMLTASSLPSRLCVISFLKSATLPALLALVCASASASDADTYPAKISRQEHLQISQMACSDAFGFDAADIDARSLSEHGRANYADVRCRPHAQLQGRPLYYVRQCARDGGEWLCSDAELETTVPLGQRVLTIRPGSVSPEKAVNTILKVASYRYYLGISIDHALESTCNLGMGDRPDMIEISCRRWSISVSYWCPKKSGNDCPRVIYMHERR